MSELLLLGGALGIVANLMGGLFSSSGGASEAAINALSQQLEQANRAHEQQMDMMRQQAQVGLREAQARVQALQDAHKIETEAIYAELERLQEAHRQEKEAKEQRRRERLEYPVHEWLSTYVHDVENLEDQKEYLNIGIVGAAGVGKSRMINKLRGFDKKSDAPSGQWAEAGVTETTILPRAYELELADADLALPVKVLLWDLPGSGTPRFPKEDYLRTVGLRHFDFVFIVSAERFRDDDLLLKEELERVKLPFGFVRTKIDIAVANNLDDNGFSEAETLAHIRADVRSQGISNPILIATKGPNQYDLPLLAETVRNELHHAMTLRNSENGTCGGSCDAGKGVELATLGIDLESSLN